MAPLPENNTAVMFYDYLTGLNATSQEHTFQVRYPGPGTLPAAVHQAVDDLIVAAIGATRFAVGWKFVRARVRQAGSTVTLPAVLPPGLATFAGTGPNLAADAEAREWTLQGRSPTSGRRVDLSLYGIALPNPANFRIQAGGGATWLVNAVEALNVNSDAGNGFVAIDNSAANWYAYMNMNYNSYWERRIRSV